MNQIVRAQYRILFLLLMVSCVNSRSLQSGSVAQQEGGQISDPPSNDVGIDLHKEVASRDASANSYGTEKGQVYTSPINDAVLGMYEHLHNYRGHILLGNQRLQLIVASVPSQAPGYLWQPLIIGGFEKRW
ncbi:MAG: hypothetical protein R3B45_01660 [Bdellovibrionota bacterium]